MRRTLPRSGPAALALALALGAVGCASETTDAPAPAPPTLASTVQVTLQSAPLAGLEVPPGVVAFGGTGGVRALLEAIARLEGQGAANGAQRGAALDAQLQAALGLRTADLLDWTRPARFVAVDIPVADAVGGATVGLAIVLGVRDAEAFAAALPTDHSAREGGNALAWSPRPGAPLRLFANFLRGRVVLTTHPGLFGRYGEFVDRVLEAQVRVGFEAILPIARESDGASIVETARALHLDERWALGLVALTRSALPDVEAASLRLDPGDDALSVRLAWAPRSGGPLASAWAAARPATRMRISPPSVRAGDALWTLAGPRQLEVARAALTASAAAAAALGDLVRSTHSALSDALAVAAQVSPPGAERVLTRDVGAHPVWRAHAALAGGASAAPPDPALAAPPDPALAAPPDPALAALVGPGTLGVAQLMAPSATVALAVALDAGQLVLSARITPRDGERAPQ